jgi:hypothetical protein
MKLLIKSLKLKPMRSVGLITAILCSLSSSWALAGGTHGGGGNGLICFVKDSHWPAQLKGEHPYDNTAHVIPNDALSEIQSIEILDLSHANHHIQVFGHRDPEPIFNRHVIAPAGHFDLITDKMWQNDKAKYVEIFENEVERYASRYEESIPQIYSDLQTAKLALPVSEINFVNHEVPQTSDYEAFQSDTPNCVVSTLFYQWRDTDQSPYQWTADARLFFHPKHSYFSQVVTLLHERIYWISRHVLTPWSDAESTYLFTTATLTQETNYGDAIANYNELFQLNGAEYLLPIAPGPAAFTKQLLADIVAVAGSNTNLPLILEVYKKQFRAKIFSANMIDDKTKKEMDKALTQYFKTGQTDPGYVFIHGWPADFNLSTLPNVKTK